MELFVKSQKEFGSIIACKENTLSDKNYPHLLIDKDNFLIAFMTNFQVHCCKLANNEYSIICIDAFHGMVNGYKLITVLNVNQGTPLAFCVSKKRAYVLLTFFEAIKIRIGKPLLSKNFMSDDAGWYYGSWQLVMDSEK